MFAIATLPFVDQAILAASPVAVGVSGGKDSQAAALATFRHLDQCGHDGPRVLVHADLGVVEWKNSLRICEELAAHLGCELLVVRRKAGDLMDRWEARWRSSIDRYAALETVTLVPCWSTPRMRFCTSELKTHVIQAELKRRYKGQTVINVTGVRREESATRSKATVADQGAANDNFINWRPIVDWSVQEVFSTIDASGLAPHPAYRDNGMSRVSCMFCIMSNIADLTAAAAQSESHDLYRRMVRLECDSSFAFQGSRWLGDVAPQLLTPDLRERLVVAKSTALWRKQAEDRITDGMLYVKGWPTRMLTDAEAIILAGVRSEIGALFDIECSFLDRDSIHDRYADLMRQREAA
ncbi:hypothetical protein AS026_21115 [Rhizobium altiplani]|uniref:Phosphoadenosine phosphosulphate reductase domain-containing protein n=1 Tax=Rhizobium altiplani TaxID=1864509 RepID=A0A120FF20_9HYPH|nr:phosphoadenosine phosphosulfate reductase family protein [Rhizobium altiplani]KWV42112.1 hypothetical protein AS026_21115 [Rhizobium altiplani]